MADVTSMADDGAADGQDPEPSQAEIDDWAAREKARRQAWLAGPTDDEKRAYATRVKQRRVSEVLDEGEQRLDETMRKGLRYGREGQLAMEGAMSLLYQWSRRKFAEFVRAGREWEEDTALPSRRRRVSFDDDPD